MLILHFESYMAQRIERNITQETLLYRAFIDTIQHHLNTGILGEGNQAIQELNNLQSHPYFQGMFTIPPNFPTNSNQALVGGGPCLSKFCKNKEKERLLKRKESRKRFGSIPEEFDDIIDKADFEHLTLTRTDFKFL